MKTKEIHVFERIIRHLIATEGPDKPLIKSDIAAQFDAETATDEDIPRRLNAAFLIALAGTEHPRYQEARDLLHQYLEQPPWQEIAQFYLDGIQRIQVEIPRACSQQPAFAEDLQEAAILLDDDEKRANTSAAVEALWQVFFPEGVGIREQQEQQIQALRAKRTVKISHLNPGPIRQPAQELLLTSNVLLTVPGQSARLEELPISPSLQQAVRQVEQEPQIYWYDHPIPIGVKAENNEVIYGLRGLQEAFEFEQQRGNAAPDEQLTCLLSVSVTHQGLHEIAKPYLEEEFQKLSQQTQEGTTGIEKLRVYVFTEVETHALIEQVLLPAARQYLDAGSEDSLLSEIFGVDGEYGRHYSFLKAMTALWQVLIDPQIKGTFKIDLDQVFPQPELVEQSGASAFEHFQTPLWGAEGVDSRDRPVELGLLAGALVNEKDIQHSLFTPDVTFPTGELSDDQLIFFSRLPQALSTQAEMMTRYRPDSQLDGRRQCIHRIHITGGTNGILVHSLRRYRPFTPTFIGRAEDQAYLLSVLLQKAPSYLRYAHQAGLIMRHDKEAFASEAIRSARLGTVIGDYIRMLWFSTYAHALPWGFEAVKTEFNPFTGSFISRIPTTVVYLRFALQAASFFGASASEEQRQAQQFVMMGARRLQNVLTRVSSDFVASQYQRERQGWDLYYDILDALEAALERQDEFAHAIQQKARQIVQNCHISRQ